MKRRQQIKLQHHTVASASEMRELENQGDIELFEPKDARHKVFHSIKHSPHKTYKGSWGTEMILWDGESEGIIHTTSSRASEIKTHISDCLFGNHNE